MAEAKKGNTKGHGFGTSAVFIAGISTILGAILFLRFGYALGHVGPLGMLAILLIGHAITIPTGLAIAEIATNLKVEGGGEFFIVSRSFGETVGGAIGISLYLSQAASVAFYMIAFSEAFRPLFGFIEQHLGFSPDIRMIGIPATIILLFVILIKGADVGVKTLWVVAGILAASLVLFFLGKPIDDSVKINLLARVEKPDDFTMVFAIVFPAFTGITAGVGLSGDLKKPRRSIPLGTLAAGVTGFVVYLAVVLKLAASAPPDQLVSDQFIMSRIALWGPIIPIGLAAATLSSAIGSILVAPRTLQALAGDGILPTRRINSFLGRGRGSKNEPFNATIVTSVIALAFVSMGSVDFVAQIISMFFMITYGALCSISFLEHFAGNPSYRPTFRSKWYLSLIGAAGCFIMMFSMQPLYAFASMVIMIVIYLSLKRRKKGERDLSEIFKGVLFQMTRRLQVLIQKRQAKVTMMNWRPSFIAISPHSLKRSSPFDLMRWISYHYGFGSYINFIKGPLTRETNEGSKDILKKLIKHTQKSDASMYVDTIISPSFRTAIAQIVQIPGISGMDNNSILFEFQQDHPEEIPDIIDGSEFAAVAEYNICVLRSAENNFGDKRKIHIWLTRRDYRNANLMIILAYIIIGHPEWKKAEIELFAAFGSANMQKEVDQLNAMIAQGRIPISYKNVKQVPISEDVVFADLVSRHSEDADLVITGFSLDKLKQEDGAFFKGFEKITDILFVRAGQNILIAEPPGGKTEG
ncbi:MAG: amino acid permease [Pseudomonadota bacterium]